MRYQNLNLLKKNFFDLINCYILNKEKSNNVEYNIKKMEELQEYVNFEDQNFIQNSFEDLIMFLETVFDFDKLTTEEYERLINKIKEIEMNFFAHQLVFKFRDFSVYDVFQEGEISIIKENSVFYVDDEVYIAKSNVKKTSKGYQITASLLFENNYKFTNNIYIEKKDKSFIILGEMKK